MIEDATVLEDGPAVEPTKRLRGLAAVEGFSATVAETVAMSENGKDVSALPVTGYQQAPKSSPFFSWTQSLLCMEGEHCG
jgi:hypothetical protein